MAVSEDECILRSFCERMDGSEFSDCVPGLHSNGLVFSFIAVAILVPELIYSFYNFTLMSETRADGLICFSSELQVVV